MDVRRLILLLCALALFLSGCGHMVVEEAPVRVGNPVYTAAPTAN